jgi:hypothetical protein
VPASAAHNAAGHAPPTQMQMQVSQYRARVLMLRFCGLRPAALLEGIGISSLLSTVHPPVPSCRRMQLVARRAAAYSSSIDSPTAQRNH